MNEMTDRVESMQIDLDELISLRQQLAESQANVKKLLTLLDDAEAVIVAQRKERLESQAREKVLRDALMIVEPFYAESVTSDSTALDTMLKQAKREALLEAVSMSIYVINRLKGEREYDFAIGASAVKDELDNMAKELKT